MCCARARTSVVGAPKPTQGLLMNSMVRASALSLVLLGTLATQPVASAHEALASTGGGATSAWTEPIAALGGIPLAVYVSRHQARRLGTPGV